MMKLHFALAIFFLIILSCSSAKTNSIKNINTESDTSQILHSIETDLEYILFGVYCGKCSGHCATMYKYNMRGDSNTLHADTTDSFLKNNEDVICQMQVHDSKQIELAKNVVEKIPNELLITREETKRFGCPNCADQCGIYFELKQKTAVKKFYIDVDTSQLSGDIKSFAEFLKKTIDKLKGQE